MDVRGTSPPAVARRRSVWQWLGIGCLTIFGIGVTAVVVAIIVFVKKNPWVGEMAQASKEFIQRSTSSPVAAELNRTLCFRASVMDAEDVRRFQKAMGESKFDPPDYRWTVTCHVLDAATTPDHCERVAAAFRRLEAGKGTLVVMVGAGFTPKPVCTVAYGPDGRPIRSIETGQPGRGSPEE